MKVENLFGIDQDAEILMTTKMLGDGNIGETYTALSIPISETLRGD